MSTISTHLRNFKEPTKDQLTQLFFALPASASSGVDAHGFANGSAPVEALEKGKEKSGPEAELEKMEINAVLSLGVQGEEDAYVSGFCCALGSGGVWMERDPLSLSLRGTNGRSV